MDIKQQIKQYLNERNASLTSVVNMINSFKPQDQQTTVQNINNKLTRGTIKYNEVLEIAQVLGYDIVWRKQKSNEINLSAFNINDIANNTTYSMESKLKNVQRNVLIEQEIQKFYSNLLLLLTNYEFPDNLHDYLKRFLSKATIDFNSIPLYSFISEHYTFLCEVLSYTQFGSDFLPTITYLKNVYYQGGINTLNESDKQNLINLCEYFYDKYFSNNNNIKKD